MNRINLRPYKTGLSRFQAGDLLLGQAKPATAGAIGLVTPGNLALGPVFSGKRAGRPRTAKHAPDQVPQPAACFTNEKFRMKNEELNDL